MGEPLHLDAHELACLQSLADRPEIAHPACGTPLLDHLVALGLLQRVPLLTLPVLPTRYGYRVTMLGQRILHERGCHS